MIILKKYIDYSISDYIKKVYGRCLLVVITSFFLTHSLYQHIYNQVFLHLVLTCVLSTASSMFFVYVLGMDKTERDKVKNIITNKLKR